MTAARRAYLDWNASAPPHPRALAAARAALGTPGNPSSTHAEGRAARDRLERARAEVAALVGGAPAEIVFTSGGTEADALGLGGLVRAARARGGPARVAVSAAGHPALLGAARALAREGVEAIELAVDPIGRVRSDALERALERGVSAVGFSLVNHELGTLEEVGPIVARCRAAGARVMLDAVQAAARLSIDALALGVDALALSGHKLGAPSGIGALWIADGARLEPLVDGHQERGRRAGTENLVGAVAFAAAAGAALEDVPAAATRLAELGASLEATALAIGGARRLAGPPTTRAPGVVSLAFDGAPGDAVVAALDLAGFACSTGAACTSGTVAPSTVLVACGHAPARAREALRISMGWSTTAAEIEALARVLPSIVERVRAFSGP